MKKELDKTDKAATCPFSRRGFLKGCSRCPGINTCRNPAGKCLGAYSI